MESALLAWSGLSWLPNRFSSSYCFLPSISHQQKPNVILTSCTDSHLLGTIFSPIQLIHHLRSSKSAIHTFPNNSSEGLADVQLQWKQVNSRCHCKPRLVCLFGGKGRGSDKDAARRALEDALSGKKDAFDRWDGEIKKREAAGGGSGNGGRRWFGGFGNEDSWKEIKQSSLAVAGLLLLYLLLAQGKSMMSVAMNSILFFLRGFRDGLRLISSARSRIGTESVSSLKDSSVVQDDTPVSAKANVIRKWGPE